VIYRATSRFARRRGCERGEFNIPLDAIVKIPAGLDTKPSALCALARL
jgi:hypothetical protein